jgi:hypothetical protein
VTADIDGGAAVFDFEVEGFLGGFGHWSLFYSGWWKRQLNLCDGSPMLNS